MSERLICVIGAIRFLLLVFSIFTLFLSFLKAFFFCSIPLRDASAESRRILVQPHTMSVFLFLFWDCLPYDFYVSAGSHVRKVGICSLLSPFGS
jgi:hypothetical protein